MALPPKMFVSVSPNFVPNFMFLSQSALDKNMQTSHRGIYYLALILCLKTVALCSWLHKKGGVEGGEKIFLPSFSRLFDILD